MYVYWVGPGVGRGLCSQRSKLMASMREDQQKKQINPLFWIFFLIYFLF